MNICWCGLIKLIIQFIKLINNHIFWELWCMIECIFILKIIVAHWLSTLGIIIFFKQAKPSERNSNYLKSIERNSKIVKVSNLKVRIVIEQWLPLNIPEIVGKVTHNRISLFEKWRTLHECTVWFGFLQRMLPKLNSVVLGPPSFKICLLTSNTIIYNKKINKKAVI